MAEERPNGDRVRPRRVARSGILLLIGFLLLNGLLFGAYRLVFLSSFTTAARESGDTLRVLIYALSTIPDGENLPATHVELTAWLSELGFPTLPVRRCEGVEAVLAAYDGLKTTRYDQPYEMDGVVALYAKVRSFIQPTWQPHPRWFAQ